MPEKIIALGEPEQALQERIVQYLKTTGKQTSGDIRSGLNLSLDQDSNKVFNRVIKAIDLHPNVKRTREKDSRSNTEKTFYRYFSNVNAGREAQVESLPHPQPTNQKQREENRQSANRFLETESVPDYVKEYILERPKNKDAEVEDKFWAIRWILKNRWLSIDDLIDLFRPVWSEISKEFDTGTVKGRREDLVSIAGPFKELLEETIKADWNPHLIRMLVSADFESKNIFDDIRDWAWKQLQEKNEPLFILQLKDIATNAPQWYFRTLWSLFSESCSRPSTDLQLKYGTGLAELLNKAPKPIEKGQWRAFKNAVEESSKSSKDTTVVVLMALLEFPSVSGKLAAEIVRVVHSIPQLQTQILSQLAEYKDSKLDEAFSDVIANKEYSEGDVWIELMAKRNLPSRKAKVLAQIILNRFQENPPVKQANAVVLIALVEKSLGENDQIKKVWRQILDAASLSALKSAQNDVVTDNTQPLQLKIVGLTENLKSRQDEVNRLSTIAHSVKEPLVANLQWARDLIPMVDDLDLAVRRADAPESLKQMREVLVKTLRKHKVNPIGAEPGQKVTLRDLHSHSKHYRVLEDISQAQVFKVVMRGYEYEDLEGNLQIERPALLDIIE